MTTTAAMAYQYGGITARAGTASPQKWRKKKIVCVVCPRTFLYL
jgi:hypothetical protein